MYRMDETGNVDLATVEPFLHDVASTSDDSLVKAARSGDVSAFEEIFERHRRRVSRLVGRFFSRPERVEEIIQDVFTKVYFGLGAYSSDRGASFGAWLSRVAINVCYDELRRTRRRPEGSVDDMTPNLSHRASPLTTCSGSGAWSVVMAHEGSASFRGRVVNRRPSRRRDVSLARACSPDRGRPRDGPAWAIRLRYRTRAT